jgi:RimJ/RimL family protein N-acetyltransferase
MPIELKQLNFTTFAQSGAEMYSLLEQNRARLAPWFWWASEKITPTKFRFYAFMALYLANTKRKQLAHKFNPLKQYDEQFFVYDEHGKIGGMVGLDNIDTKNKNAELWGLAFKGQTQTIESVKILEDYCINTLNLNSIYGRVQSTNRACRLFWEKYGYDKKTLEQNVQVSKHNPNIADMYTYTKILTR